MSGVKKLKALSLALIVLFLMNSCADFFSTSADFFSTSWGKIFKRDPKKVKVESSNVYDLLDAAKGDQDLSRAILDQINADSEASLKSAAIQAANQSAGISTLALEHISGLIDAMESSGDKGSALQGVVDKILTDIKGNDLEVISDKLNTIFANEVKVSLYANPGETLKNTGKIEVSASKSGSSGSGDATITLVVNNKNTGAGTVTIVSPGGTSEIYDCIVNDDGTITLTQEGENGPIDMGTIKYTINEDNSLTLSDLDNIPGAGLADTSEPSGKNTLATGKPEFEAGFLDSVPESDVTLAVITLILAKAEKERDATGSLDKYLETWSSKDVETGKGLDMEEVLIAALINGMIERGEDTGVLTDLLTDLLGIEL